MSPELAFVLGAALVLIVWAAFVPAHIRQARRAVRESYALGVDHGRERERFDRWCNAALADLRVHPVAQVRHLPHCATEHGHPDCDCAEGRA